ncbi:hypothetical protein E8E11_003927 [Didymella keratinophila]|nr:hypothetical protein E8E11_003927 [Didymella keratinophila]
MSAAQLLQSNNAPLTEARKAHFENLRKKHVPRYLFRAWSSRSGGGSSRTINSTTEIIPRRFMPGTNRPIDFYSINEDLLHQLALQHFEHRQSVITGFSSWAASLHLVLCYAKSMDPKTNPHVAVIDTHELGNQEYLAWGCIRGRGYKAVLLKKLEASGVPDIFPSLKDGTYREGITFEFGSVYRSKSFTKAPLPWSPKVYEAAQRVGSLFGHLFLPVYTALLCLRPRPGLVDSDTLDRVAVSEAMGAVDRAGAADILNSIRLDDWLRPDKVDMHGFPDVKQWITLLRALVQHQIQRDLKKAESQATNRTC